MGREGPVRPNAGRQAEEESEALPPTAPVARASITDMVRFVKPKTVFAASHLVTPRSTRGPDFLPREGPRGKAAGSRVKHGRRGFEVESGC